MDVLRPKGGELLVGGGIRHAVVEGVDEIEIAYALVPEFWGQGLATEMARDCVNIANTLEIRELVAFTLTTNIASRRVTEKLGFRFGKEFIHHQNPHVLYRLP